LFAIVDPQLELDQLEAVQRDVSRLLEHGLDTPAPPAPDIPAASDSLHDGVPGEERLDAEAIPDPG
jgi:hypothetical protein